MSFDGGVHVSKVAPLYGGWFGNLGRIILKSTDFWHVSCSQVGGPMGKEIRWGTAGPIILLFLGSMVGDDGADFNSTGFSEI